jgi:tRNA-dihydrouridine synthase B
MTRKFPALSSKALLSPMAGVTDVAFRAVAKSAGAGLTCTEFVSATALVRASEKTQHLLEVHPSETPVAVQLFGSNIADVIDAARQVQDSFDIIDINCGCPAYKVIKTGAGSELLKDPQKIAHIVNELVSHVTKPVTVKIRIGIEESQLNAVEVAKLVEQAGASAIAVHGRTQSQGYSGKADWSVISQVKQAVNIPVIGNGDVFTVADFAQRIEQSGVDYILIARGAIGNPLVFRQIVEFEKTGTFSPISSQEHFESFFSYLSLAKHYDIPVSVIKNQAMYWTKGVVGGSKIRQQLASAKTIEDCEKIIRTI